MKRTTGIRMTVWLGIFAICLAVFMPGVNALKNHYQGSGHDIFTADICSGAQTLPATGADYTSHDEMPVLQAGLVDGHSQAPAGHHADHAAECLYCGFFTHNLPLLYTAQLPAMAYGFVSRIAPQHPRTSYYARPAFVPLSRAPPALS